MLAARAASAAPTRGRDPYDEVHWMALLRSLAAYQPFRRAMPTRPDDGSTLRFLLQDESFPRAVASCLGELRAILKRLPNNEPVLTACTDAAVLVADVPVDRLTAPELLVLVDDLQAAVLAIHKLLDAVYFHPAAVDGVLDPGPQMTTPRTDRSVAPRLESDSVGDVAGRRTYRVTHRTTFDYDAPVEQAYNEAHLHPRDTDHQLCVYHDIAVEPPPSSRSEYVDAYGNTATIFVVKGGFDRLTVTATSEVVVISPLEPPPSLPWESAQWLLEIDRRPAARVARRFIAPSRLVPALEELAEYAGPSFGAGRPLVDAVVDLAGRIHRDFVYEPGFTTVTTPLCDVFQFRRGVCQDFAHLAIGCLRSLGLAARYVSGYIETIAPSGQERLVGADASHAWFSVHVPGWGWLDVDPTNDQLVSDSYVTTAWGRDYWDVSPLRGSVEGGGASHHMDVAVDVQRMTGSSAD
jgi:transglutaminase-like putative cysteine protease